MVRVRLRTGAVCRQPIPLDAAAVCGEGSASTAILVPIEFNPKCHAILMGNLSCSATTKMRRSVNQDETRQQRWNAERA
ncbi:hypothetical protein EPK84_13070 (plasmid) [Sinorhizobium fredii]|nr:hypothetical protein EPK84_13070 [Sinorhizobium fredii]